MDHNTDTWTIINVAVRQMLIISESLGGDAYNSVTTPWCHDDRDRGRVQDPRLCASPSGGSAVELMLDGDGGVLASSGGTHGCAVTPAAQARLPHRPRPPYPSGFAAAVLSPHRSLRSLGGPTLGCFPRWGKQMATCGRERSDVAFPVGQVVLHDREDRVQDVVDRLEDVLVPETQQPEPEVAEPSITLLVVAALGVL